jgi:hypothetical protein
MNYNAFENFVSKPRLERYLACCTYSQEKAMMLYGANLKVSKAFYPILNLFEIFLRNSIDNKLGIYFADSEWIINQKMGFMNDATLGPKFWLKNQVVKAETDLRAKGVKGKIVAEQSFGFWTCLFEPKHYKLVGGYIIHCFPNKPPTVNRNYLALSLKEIREFRNRIYHNEAICFNEMNIDFKHAKHIQNELYDLLKWMNPELSDFVCQFDNIEKEIEGALGI